jgi:hypothetical protein
MARKTVVDEVATEAAPEVAANVAETVRYLVVVRHSPAPLKKLECDAVSEDDAFRQYMAALRVKLGEKSSQAEEMVVGGQKSVKRL